MKANTNDNGDGVASLDLDSKRSGIVISPEEMVSISRKTYI